MGATILNDCRIGEGSIIAAGAVIPEHTVIPPNSLVAGVPGKVRRTLGDDDRKLILKYAQNYLDYTAIYLKEMAAAAAAGRLRPGVAPDLFRTPFSHGNRKICSSRFDASRRAISVSISREKPLNTMPDADQRSQNPHRA